MFKSSIFPVVMLSCLILLFCGCANITKIDPFSDLYSTFQESQESGSSFSREPKYTISVSDMLLSDFAVYFSDLTGRGIVYSESLDKKYVTMEVKNSTASEAISFLSRRYGMSLVQTESMFYLGAITSNDKGVFVKKVRGYSVDDLKKSFQSMFGEGGKLHVTESGVVIFVDSETVILKAVELCSKLESFSPVTWCVQFYILSRSHDSRFQIGANLAPSGDLSVMLQSLHGRIIDNRLSAIFDPILQGKSVLGDLLCSPMVLLVDGATVSWSDGQQTPIPNRTVSDQGTVTTSGYTRVDSGLKIVCQFRESGTGALLDFQIEDSSIVAYVENAPQLTMTGLQTKTFVEGGRVYLLGEYLRQRTNRGLSSLLVRDRSVSSSTIYIFCRVYRIDHNDFDVDFKAF